LLDEVEAAFRRTAPPGSDRDAYAVGILRNWKQVGRPSGVRKKQSSALQSQIESYARRDAIKAASEAALLADSRAGEQRTSLQKRVALVRTKVAERVAAAVAL
jgi:hypothetical protein